LSKIFFDVAVSLDGYIAGPNRGPRNPLGDRGTSIHNWMFQTASFRKMIGLPGGDTSEDDAVVRAVFERSGAYVMGRHMFEEGEIGWPEDAPFHAPVFVLTHTPREPWPRKGGTTFHFVTDGMKSALEQAKAAARGKDVRISGGAQTIRQFLKAGLVDEFTLHVAPVILGAGVSLFDHMAHGDFTAEQAQVIPSRLATHITYRVAR
jgi:dihydrofolate reductase